jgi:hypothetical protein
MTMLQTERDRRTGAHRTGYSVRKHGDNYALCFNGQVVESGVFATRKTANKHKVIAEHDRRQRLAAKKQG